MVCSGVEPGVSGWNAQTNSLSYRLCKSNWPILIQLSSAMNLDRSSLQFTSELGKGWFGFVLRGTVNNLTNTFEPTYNFEELRVPVEAIRYDDHILISPKKIDSTEWGRLSVTRWLYYFFNICEFFNHKTVSNSIEKSVPKKVQHFANY